MELKDAFIRSIRSYYEDKGLKETGSLVAGDETEREGLKYTKSYFDDLEAAREEDNLPEEKDEGLEGNKYE